MSNIEIKEISSDHSIKSHLVWSSRSLSDLDVVRLNYPIKVKKNPALPLSKLKKSDMPELDPQKVNAFHEAICKNDIEQVRKLLDSGMDPNVEVAYSQKVPLIEAVKRGFVNIVKNLLIAHVDVNKCNHQGTTALHVCMHPMNFNKEIIQLFLQYQSTNFNIQDKLANSSPLHILTKTVCSNSNKNVTRDEIKEIFKEIVPRCNLNLRDVMGNTPLHILAKGKEDDIEIMEIFLFEKPDVNVRNHVGETPLTTAINNGNFNMASAILKHDVDTGVRDRWERTLLHYAVKNNSTAIVEKLLEKGSDVNAQDSRGDTALHIAAGRGLVDIAYILLRHPEIEINKQNKEGYTPLMCAVDSYFVKVVKVLIDVNCDLDIKSFESGKTAFDIAKDHMIKRNKKDIYHILSLKQKF